MNRLSYLFAGRRRWLTVGLLFLVAAVNYLDRQSLSVLEPTVAAQLHFGPVEYSYVVTAFLAAYTLGYLFCAQAIDKLGVKTGLALALGCWSLTDMLHSAVTGWRSLAIVRFLLGLSESFSSPAGVKAIHDWIPVRERGAAMAMFSNGNVLGFLLAPPLLAALTHYVGWRWAFLTTGLLGLILLAVWWRQYETPDVDSRLSNVERTMIIAGRAPIEGKQRKRTMRQLLISPICLGFFLTRFLTDSISYFFTFWLPDYFVHARGFTLGLIGLIGWIPYLAQAIGNIAGGSFSDRLIRSGWEPGRSRLALMLAAALLMPLANLAVRTDYLWMAVGLVGVLLAAQGCWMVNILSLVSESVAPENVTTLLALSALGGSVGGMISSLMVGRAIKAFGYVPVFSVLSAVPLTAFSVLAFSRVIARRSEET